MWFGLEPEDVTFLRNWVFGLATFQIDGLFSKNSFVIKRNKLMVKVMKNNLQHRLWMLDLFQHILSDYRQAGQMNFEGIFSTNFVKVNSVQEACAKCFAVHILKFEITNETKFSVFHQ